MLTALWILCALAVPEVEVSPFSATNDELRAYLVEAGESHPGLEARHQEWLAALERIPQVKSLDDPMFTYGQFLQSDVNRVKFSLAQKFPWFGTLRTRGDKAAAEAEAALERFYSMRNRIFADVKRAYFNYSFLGESIRVTDAQTQILGYMEGIVRSKYSLGVASEADLLRIQIEQTEVQDRYDGLMQVRPALSAKLAEVLGRVPAENLPWPQKVALPPPPPPSPEVFSLIHTANPDLKALQNQIEAREHQAGLARKKGFPDFTIGMDYSSVSKPRKIRPDRPFPGSLHAARRLATGTSMGTAGLFTDLYSVANADEPMSYRSGGEDNIMVSLRMNLPIWRKRIKAGIQEAKLLERSVQHKKRAKELSLDSSAKMAIFEMEDGLRRFNLYEDSLVPQAKRSFESLQSAYASGGTSADFLDVLDSVRLLLDFELNQVRAARDLHIAAADLEFLTGGPRHGTVKHEE